MTTLRKSKRIASHIPCFFYTYGKKRLANITDFSQSGIFLNCQLILKKNSILTLHFTSQVRKAYTVRYQIVRAQSGINLNSSKSYLRGMGLELIDHQNPFDLFQPFSKEAPNNLKNDLLKKPVHIIAFKHLYDFINLYHAQLSKLNFTFMSAYPTQNNTTIEVVIRSDDVVFSTSFDVRVIKSVKDNHTKQYYIYSVISNEAFNQLRNTVDELFIKHKIYKNTPIPIQGKVLQHPIAKLILKSIENKFSGQLQLKNFLHQSIASCYFKEGHLLHIHSNNAQRFFRMITEHPDVPQRSKNQLLNDPIEMHSALELRDILIRKNIIESRLMFQIWTQYTLKNFRLLGNMLNLEFEFIKKLPKEMIALNQALDIKSHVFKLLNSIDDVFLHHYNHQHKDENFIIHKQKLYLWPEKILSVHYKINENIVYTQKKLSRDLDISNKETLALICYLNFIDEVILV